MVGNIEAIDEASTAFKENRLVLKIVDGLQDYLSCDVRFSGTKKQAWLGQPHLIKNLKKVCGTSQKRKKSQNMRYAKIFNC